MIFALGSWHRAPKALGISRGLSVLLKILHLLIFACAGSSLLHVGFLQLQQARATLPCSEWASHCGGFSCCGAGGFGCTGFSSCGAQASLLRSTWNLPGPGIEPVFPALAGGFLSTVPVGKSLSVSLYTNETTHRWGKTASRQSPERPPWKGQGLGTGFSHQRPIKSVMPVQ